MEVWGNEESLYGYAVLYALGMWVTLTVTLPPSSCLLGTFMLKGIL